MRGGRVEGAGLAADEEDGIVGVYVAGNPTGTITAGDRIALQGKKQGAEGKDKEAFVHVLMVKSDKRRSRFAARKDYQGDWRDCQ